MLIQQAERADSLGMAGGPGLGLQSEYPQAKNAWLTLLTFDLLIKILHALLNDKHSSIVIFTTVVQGAKAETLEGTEYWAANKGSYINCQP